MSAPRPDLLGPIDRRTFLRATAGGTAALAVAALLPAGCGGYPPVSGLRLFTAKEFAVVDAMIATFVTPPAGAPSAREVGIAAYLDRYLAAEAPLVQKQLKQALLLIEYGGFWWGPRRRRCTRMAPADRAQYLREWLDSDSAFRRQVAQTFRRAILNTYYTDERTWEAIGYEGPFVDPDESTVPTRVAG